MRIVRKIEFRPATEFFYHTKNTADNYMTIELCNCYSITGQFQAISSLEFMNTGYPESRITYFPNFNDPTFINDHTFDPDYTPPEINFRLYPKEPQPMEGYPKEIEDKMNEPIIIPPNTCSISLEIAAGDDVAIWGQIAESYAIIDDDGNEIPLESILPSKRQITDKTNNQCELDLD